MSSRLSAAERAACRETIARHSRSFYLASRLLPDAIREAAWALYAFCRASDDAVDVPLSPAASLRAVERLRGRLAALYAGRPESLADQAFMRIVARHALPRALPETLLDGLESDARCARFQTEEDLLRYGFQVASTVGLMVTRIMGVARPDAYLRAAHLGLAMQLTNIARDLGEDAHMGRLYAPELWLGELGLARGAFLAAPRPDGAARALVRRLSARAEAHYQAADAGIALLPASCRPAIAAARHLYAAIGVAIARNDYDAVTRRAIVSPAQRLQALGRAAVLAARPPACREGPADALLLGWIRALGLHEGAPLREAGALVRAEEPS